MALPEPASHHRRGRLAHWSYLALILTAGAVALFPLADRLTARIQARSALKAALQALDTPAPSGAGFSQGAIPDARCASTPGLSNAPLPVSPNAQLASWGNVGGCGAGGGGGGSTGGGIKWIGRKVTGGMLDLECLTNQTFDSGNAFTAINTRAGTGLGQQWELALNVPILYKVGTVTTPQPGDVLADKTANIAGFGDLSLELTRKLGLTNASRATLILSGPTGAHNAQRQGVLLPAQLQLGSGVLSATGQFEHTIDRDWGLMIVGGNATYNGWENSAGGFRGSTISGYGYLGYLLGPLVPSAGLSLLGKFAHDRQADPDPLVPLVQKASVPLVEDPLLLVTPQLGLEWSMDWLALLLASTASFSYYGFENVSVTLGIATSVF